MLPPPLGRDTCTLSAYNIGSSFLLYILSLHRLGAWQFLADMPFGSVSTETLWKLFWALYGDVTKLDSVESLQRDDSIWDKWREELQSMYTQAITIPFRNFLCFS